MWIEKLVAARAAAWKNLKNFSMGITHAGLLPGTIALIPLPGFPFQALPLSMSARLLSTLLLALITCSILLLRFPPPPLPRSLPACGPAVAGPRIFREEHPLAALQEALAPSGPPFTDRTPLCSLTFL